MDATKPGHLERALKGTPVTRRWLLRNSANITAGTVAISALGAGTARLEAAALHADSILPHCDLETGEIFDRERHHRWDTI